MRAPLSTWCGVMSPPRHCHTALPAAPMPSGASAATRFHQLGRNPAGNFWRSSATFPQVRHVRAMTHVGNASRTGWRGSCPWLCRTSTCSERPCFRLCRHWPLGQAPRCRAACGVTRAGEWLTYPSTRPGRRRPPSESESLPASGRNDRVRVIPAQPATPCDRSRGR